MPHPHRTRNGCSIRMDEDSGTVGPMSTGLRRDALRNRERVLAAARRMRLRGESLQPNVVAREAGVGVGTVYRHFATPQELTETLVLDAFVALEHEAVQVDDDRDVHAFLEQALTVFASDEDFAAVATAASPVLDATAESRQRLLDAVSRAFERAWGDDRLRPGITAADVLVMLCGLGHAIRHSDTAADRAGAYLDAFLSGILRHSD